MACMCVISKYLLSWDSSLTKTSRLPQFRYLHRYSCIYQPARKDEQLGWLCAVCYSLGCGFKADITNSRDTRWKYYSLCNNVVKDLKPYISKIICYVNVCSSLGCIKKRLEPPRNLHTTVHARHHTNIYWKVFEKSHWLQKHLQLEAILMR